MGWSVVACCDRPSVRVQWEGGAHPAVRPRGIHDRSFPVLSVPGPLEDYLQQFGRSLGSRARRRALRDYVIALLQPRDRSKTLTALARAEPLVGACHREAQRLQCVLSGSAEDHAALTARRGVDLLLGLADAEPGISPGLALAGAAPRGGDHPGRRGAAGRVIDCDGHALCSAQRLSCRG